ncbi:amino acid ABC transporter permease [Actinosynnema sp. NPDC047251]|uniref:ABC-type amino acid transporter, permease subunit n=1 Tax=Saccharothrix espanaensis (strain ATCC 51144 / DSM 44229 / JCM 9112 / NBRC 15066 / NRRL 15764) TaxID=1179773 RepID=K0KB03_SACES|nr:amino acid ABC transporter permease [Saccharothrix espanaensis]CCH34702.1 ABC-type amino acid transporter, permease subunit [Saccharothrix espanaensis DSM 44229]
MSASTVVSPPQARKVAEIVPLRRPWRWASAALVLSALVVVLWSVVTNEQFQWGVVAQYFTTEAVLRGLGLTLWVTALTVVLGFVIGGVLAVMRLSGNPVLVGVSWGYVWLFRSVPLLVQLLFWFNIGALYPVLSGATPIIGPVTAVIIGLVLHEAAYAAEVVRGGILSVDAGQVEAALALGMRRGRVLRRIVLPQAMRAIIPAAGNMLIGTLKGTSIVSVLAVQDLLYSVQLIYNRNYLIIPLLLVATVWYVVVTSLLGVGQHYVERFYARGAGRQS